MGQFQVEKERVNVRIVLVDGHVIEGSVFLALHSSYGVGRQTMREILEDPNSFMPINDTTGGFALVGKGRIGAVSLGLELDPTPEFTKRVKARLLIQGMAEEVAGELIVPEGPSAFRVSDYLNSSEQWFRVEEGETLMMIPKKAVQEVRLN